MTPSNQREAAEVAQPRLRHSRRRPFKYRGVRKRSWGRWVAEIRVPKSSERIWLGSYASAHQAARAYDVAAACLRGPGAARNLPLHAVPQPGRCLSPASIRDLAAQEAAGFTLLDDEDDEPTPPEHSSATSIMQHCSNNSALPAASLAADEYNLQQEVPASEQNLRSALNLNTESDYYREVLDNEQMGLRELHSLQEWEATDSDVHAHVYSEAAPPVSAQRDAQIQHLEAEEAHAQDRPPSLLDLWFCLDIGPAVHPSLKALLAHSLYPENGQ